MSKKRFAGVFSLMLLVMMLAAVVFSVPVGASSTPDSTASTQIESGSLEMIAYAVTDAAGNSKTTINRDETFKLSLKLRDTRPEALAAIAASASPIGTVNSSSFKPLAAGSVTGTVSGDVITFIFDLRYTGTGNAFQCDLSYSSYNVPVESVSLTLNQARDTSNETPPTTIGTGFVLKSASYGGSEVVAGQAFTLSASLMATNGTNNVENASVTLVLPKEIKFETGSSIYYIGTVKPGQTVTASFALQPVATAEEGSYTVTIKMSGINPADGSAVEASAEVTIPLEQPERFEISNARMPEYLMVGMNDGSGYGSLDLVNKGKGSMFNVEVEIVGEGLSTEEGKQYIGTIAGGTQSSVDFTVLADMPGMIEAKVVVTYENSKGDVKTLEHEFTVTAEEMMMPDPGVDPEFPLEEPQGGGGIPGWVWALAALVVIAGGVVALVVVRKKRKAKKDAELDAELYDDDDDDFTPAPAEPVDGVPVNDEPAAQNAEDGNETF